jgi:hypothetical protein
MPLQQEGDKKAGGTVTKKRIVSNVGVFIGVEGFWKGGNEF